MDWIQATESFAGWMSSPGSSVLHMDGKPGSGTTVLSSHVIRLLRADTNANTILATFTAAVQTTDSCQVTDMLVALSQQLLSREPDAFQGCTFLCSWMMSLSKFFITEAIAWSLLRSIVSVMRDPVYFIIRHFDLLSPTPGWEHALVKLSHIGKPGQALRILVTTTRPLSSTALESNRTTPRDPGEDWKSLSGAYRNFNPSLSQDLPVGYFNILLENRQDMSSAIENTVRKRIDLCSQESKLWSELREEVVTRICVPGTTYLLATQQIEYLRSSLFHATKSNLRRGLKELPLTQDAIYTRTLEPLSKERRHWAMVALAWIVFSIRQLDDRELALALAFESGAVGDVQALRENMSYDIAGDLAKVIGPFFKIVGSQLYPIHRTLGSIADLSSYAAKFHAKATITCLTYLSVILSHDDIIKPKGELSDEVSKRTDCVFLSYSVIHWPDHYRSALSDYDSGDLVDRTYDLLENPHLLAKWSKLYTIFTRSGVWEEPTVPLSSGLNVACRFGLLSLAKAYSFGKKGSFFDGKVGADALDLAAQFGQAAVVSWLVENGATSPNALSLAATGGHISIVDDLFKNGFDPSRKDKAGYTPVLHAAERGHIEVLNCLLEDGGKELAKGTAPDGSTALHFASRIGHSEAVQKLLIEGADRMQEDASGQIPLHLAAAGGYTDVIVALRPGSESLTKTTTTNDGGDTPLHLAALSGNAKACQLHLSFGSLPLLTIRNKKGWTPLHVASDSGHLDVVRLFLSHLDKANIQKRAEETSKEETSKKTAKEETQAPQLNPPTVNLDEFPALLAAGSGHVAVMMELLNHLGKERHGRDSTLSTENFRGLDEAHSCLRIAAGKGQVGALMQLLRAEVDVSSPDPMGNTALQLAVKNNHLSAIEELLRQASSEDKNAALMLAVLSSNADVTRKLIGSGAEVATDSSGVSPLHAAVGKGDEVVMSELLETETGAKLFADVIDDLVSLAAINGHTVIVKDLFRRNREARESKDSKEHDELFFGRILTRIPAWDNPNAFRTLLEAGFPSNIKPSPKAPLHVAAERGFDDIIDLLVTNGATIDQKTDDGETALMIATGNGKVSTCKCLLGHGADANSTDSDQATPLIIACRAGSKELATSLLDHNANIHAANSRGETPLHAAIEAPELLRFLLGRSPKPNMEVPGADERTPLLEAAMKGNLESANLLLKEHASIVATDYWGRTCLHLALGSRHLDVVELFVQNGVDCNARDESNFTPLHYAAISGFLEAIEYLIPRIADINAVSTSGTALAVIAIGAYRGRGIGGNWEECIRCAEILISNKANVNCYGGDIHSPLQAAVWYEAPDLVKLFLSNGAEVEAKGGWFTNALNAAVECNRADIAEMLMGASASPSVVLSDGQTILSRAIVDSTSEVVEALLQPHGQDVSQDAIDEAARTAVKYDKLSLFKSLLLKNVSTGAKGAGLPPILFDAISSSGDEVLYFLLGEGKEHIDINETNAHGMTALAYAVMGDYYYLDELLDAGANPNIADKTGNTPLTYAAKASNEEFVRILLRKAARLDLLDFAGRGALYWACYFQNESLFNTLMDSLDMEESTKMGCNSAMHAAAARSMREILGQLLEAGADLLHRDRNNWSITDTAEEYDASEILEELLPLIENSQFPPSETENSPEDLAALKRPTVWNKLDAHREVEISEDGMKMTLKGTSAPYNGLA
jgi:ankyrin repeat protein